MEKISIIVPVYKVEKYLDRCVESIVNQTYKNLEIILVDDGSPDNCPQMCDDWAKKDNRIKVIHKENGGVSSARNVGIDNATGKYIQFVDSDDYLELNACEVLLNNMKETNADLVVGNVKYNGFKTKSSNIKSFVTDKQDYAFINLSQNSLYSGLWNKLYKKSLIDSKFIIKQKYYEDFIFICEYLKNCKIICYSDSIVYNYIAVKESAVHSYSEARFDNNCYTINYIENVLKKRYIGHEDFFNRLEVNALVTPFIHVVKTEKLKYREKRNLLKKYMQSNEFIKLYKVKNDFKRKVFLFLVKHKCINILKLIFKLKKI